jgi:DNA-binding NarL/FixJ family response regulator
LRIASVAGGRIGHRLLAQVAGQDGAELDVLLRELVDRGLLVTAGDGYDFRHALIRQAVYEDLLPGERARLHARYAAALSDRQFAARLHISPSTAGVHVSHILTKLGAATRTEAAVIAFHDGLARPATT